MRPSVITCVSSLRNPACRSELHRGHSSGQSDTPVNKLNPQTVTPWLRIRTLSLTHKGVLPYWSDPSSLPNSDFQKQLRPRRGGALPEKPRRGLPESPLPAAVHQRVCGRPLCKGLGRQVAADQIQVLFLFVHAAQQPKCYTLTNLQPQLKPVPQRGFQKLVANVQPLVRQLKSAEYCPSWKENGLYAVKHFTVWSSACWAVEQVLIFACKMWGLWEERGPQTFAALQWYSDECSQKSTQPCCFKILFPACCYNLSCHCWLLAMCSAKEKKKKICQIILYISETFDCWLFYCQSTVVLYLYSDERVPFSLNNCCIFCWEQKKERIKSNKNWVACVFVLSWCSLQGFQLIVIQKNPLTVVRELRCRSRQLISLMSQGLSAKCPVHLSHYTRHAVATHLVEIKWATHYVVFFPQVFGNVACMSRQAAGLVFWHSCLLRKWL